MVPQIQITQAFGMIGLRYQPSQLTIQSQQADLELHSSSPQLTIEQAPGKLEIDQSEAFAQEGLMPPLVLAREEAQKALSTAQEGVSDTANWGDQLARAHNNNQVQSAWLMRYYDKQVQVAPALVPSPFSVHTSYIMGRLSIELRSGHIQEHVTLHQPQINVQLGSAQTYLERPSSIEISSPALGQLIDLRA